MQQYLPHQYDLTNLIYDISESTDNNKIIRIYDGKKDKPLYIQTPEIVNIFGVIKKKKYNEILLPLGGVQCLVFKNFINNLQNKVLLDANTNKNSWFNLTTNSETKRQNINKSVKFTPIIKEINKDATTTMNQTEDLQKCDEGVIKIKITDSTIIKKDSVDISINELTTNSKIRMIIQVYAIWVTIDVNPETNTIINTFGVYLKPEIIEERTSYNLTFIEEEKVIFDSDSEDDDDSSIESDSNSGVKSESDIESD